VDGLEFLPQSGVLAAATYGRGVYETELPGPAAKLVFNQQPTNTSAVVNPPVTVDVVDQLGNIETGDNTTQVTVSEASGPGGAYLSQTATVVNGVATFGQATGNPIIITTLGTYTLQATSSPALTPATSNAFTVTPQVDNIGVFRASTGAWFLD